MKDKTYKLIVKAVRNQNEILGALRRRVVA